jgi:hypothetical protein
MPNNCKKGTDFTVDEEEEVTHDGRFPTEDVNQPPTWLTMGDFKDRDA